MSGAMQKGAVVGALKPPLESRPPLATEVLAGASSASSEQLLSVAFDPPFQPCHMRKRRPCRSLPTPDRSRPVQLDLFASSPTPPAPPVAVLTSNAPLRPSARPEPAAPSATGPRLPADLEEARALFDDSVCDRKDRAQVRSAMKTVGKVLGLELALISADPVKLAPLLRAANPASAGVKPRNWVQVKSRTLGALRSCGIDMPASRSTTPLSAEWASLMGSLPTRQLQTGLSRFLHFLSRTGVTALAVSPDAYAAFKAELEGSSAISNPAQCVRRTAKLWNEAKATVSGWPGVTLPVESDARRYSLEWCAFPASFVDDVDAFVSAKANTDPLADGPDYVRATRSATAEGRRGALRLIGSALVHSGAVQMEQLTSLSVLLDIEHVRAALRHMRETRADGKITPAHLNHVWLLRTIAMHWVKDDDKVGELKLLLANLKKHIGESTAPGLTTKNRERLRQFDIPANVDALLALPHRTLRSIRAKPTPTYTDSVRVMYALQISILTFVPIRSKNLNELKLRINLIDVGQGSKRSVRIHLPAATTKTYQDYEAPLPERLFELLDSWIKEHRQRICPFESDLLFPNPQGQQRSREALALKLTRFVERETGLVINLHLFRHIAAKLYLDINPNGVEVVRQLLGHSSIRTTLRVYAELRTDPAFKRLEEALDEVGYRARPPGLAGAKVRGRA